MHLNFGLGYWWITGLLMNFEQILDNIIKLKTEIELYIT